MGVRCKCGSSFKMGNHAKRMFCLCNKWCVLSGVTHAFTERMLSQLAPDERVTCLAANSFEGVVDAMFVEC